MTPTKRRKPSDLLKQQKETGLSYWDMIGYPLPEVTVTSTYPYEDRVWDTVDNLDTRKEGAPEFINRLNNNDRRYIIDEDNGKPSTFLMSNDGRYAYPLVQDINGSLHNYDTKYGDYWYRQPYENGDYIKFNTTGDARYFTEHYKDHWPEYFKGFKNGKQPIKLPGYDEGTPSNNVAKYKMADGGQFIRAAGSWTPAGSFLDYGALNDDLPGEYFCYYGSDGGLYGIGIDDQTGERFSYTPLLDEVVVKPDKKLMNALKEKIPNDNIRKAVLLQIYDENNSNHVGGVLYDHYGTVNLEAMPPNYPVRKLLLLIDIANVPKIKRTEELAEEDVDRPYYRPINNTIYDRPYGDNYTSYIHELYHALLNGIDPIGADMLGIKLLLKYGNALTNFEPYHHYGTEEYNAHSELPNIVHKYLFPEDVQDFLYNPVIEIKKSMDNANKFSSLRSRGSVNPWADLFYNTKKPQLK